MTKAPFLYLSQELGVLSNAKNYYRWILGYFKDYLGNRVIEVGPGYGAFSELLLSEAKAEELILVEPADNHFSLLQSRFSGKKGIQFIHGYLEELPDSISADSLIAINVFGLIEDDEAFLKFVHKRLKAGGHLLLFAPALPFLYGTLDVAFGMVRRYTKSGLASLIQTAGFHVEWVRYFNFIGVVGWFIGGKLLQKRTLNSFDVKLYDQWVVPWMSRLEKGWEPPIGQSLLAVARKRI